MTRMQSSRAGYTLDGVSNWAEHQVDTTTHVNGPNAMNEYELAEWRLENLAAR